MRERKEKGLPAGSNLFDLNNTDERNVTESGEIVEVVEVAEMMDKVGQEPLIPEKAPEIKERLNFCRKFLASDARFKGNHSWRMPAGGVIRVRKEEKEGRRTCCSFDSAVCCPLMYRNLL